MTLNKLLQLMLLNEHLKIGQTGGSRRLSKLVGVSRTTLFDMFKVLKKMGGKVVFDYKENTFRYENDFDLEVSTTIEERKVLSIKDLKRIIGGRDEIFEVPTLFTNTKNNPPNYI